MAARKKTDRSQEEFGRALYQTLTEIDRTYDVSSGIIWQRTGRPGVFLVIIRSSRFSQDSGTRRQVARISAEWPNSATTDVVAFLFGLAVKLERMLDEDSAMGIIPG